MYYNDLASFENTKSNIVSSALGIALSLTNSSTWSNIITAITGVTNNGAISKYITPKKYDYTRYYIPKGYHDGNGYVYVYDAEDIYDEGYDDGYDSGGGGSSSSIIYTTGTFTFKKNANTTLELGFQANIFCCTATNGTSNPAGVYCTVDGLTCNLIYGASNTYIKNFVESVNSSSIVFKYGTATNSKNVQYFAAQI